jgi:hypothetical protein
MIDDKLVAAELVAEAWADCELATAPARAQVLRAKATPAKGAAHEIRAKGKELAALRREAKYTQWVLKLYEWHFPWLSDLCDDDEARAYLGRPAEPTEADPEADPVSRWLTHEEFAKLSEDERNQRALDRYLVSRKSPWELGREFLGHKVFLTRDRAAARTLGVNRGHPPGTGGGAQPRVWVAIPAPPELRPAVADPERGDALVAAAGAGHREAPVGSDHVGLLEHERDAFVQRQRRAAGSENVAQRLLRGDTAAIGAEINVNGSICGCIGELDSGDRRESVEVVRLKVTEHHLLSPPHDPRGGGRDRHHVTRKGEHRARLRSSRGAQAGRDVESALTERGDLLVEGQRPHLHHPTSLETAEGARDPAEPIERPHPP